MMPLVGTIIHVAGSSGRCRAAIVLDTGPIVQRVRVFGRTEHDPDEWGDVAHVTDMRVIPNPPDVGGVRVLDSWHVASGLECDRAHERIDRALVGVVGF